jgi:hypothetical protein
MSRSIPTLLFGALVLVAAACGDDGPKLFGHDDEHLLLFKRVTLAADARDRAEIEIEVRSGPDFAEPAPDGTTVAFETTGGVFVGSGSVVETATSCGHAVVTLLLPEPGQLAITASVRDSETCLLLELSDDGSIRIAPP